MGAFPNAPIAVAHCFFVALVPCSGRRRRRLQQSSARNALYLDWTGLEGLVFLLLPDPHGIGWQSALRIGHP